MLDSTRESCVFLLYMLLPTHATIVELGYGFIICNKIGSKNNRVFINKMDAYEAIKDA